MLQALLMVPQAGATRPGPVDEEKEQINEQLKEVEQAKSRLYRM
jgi:hypothetical protein